VKSNPREGEQHELSVSVLARSRADVPRRQGRQTRPGPDPRRGQVGQIQADHRCLRSHARRGLVRAAAGRLQADAQRQGRRDPGSPGRNARLLRYDPLRGDGRRDSSRQDHPRSAELRPRLRRDQRCDA